MPSAQALFPSQPEPSRQLLLDWLKLNGTVLHDGLEICDSGDGWGVRAKRDIEFDELLLSIPKASILSARTTSLELPTELVVPDVGGSNWATKASTNLTVPTLALILLHEIRLGENGKFWGYIQSLPRNVEGLPMFWDEGSEERMWLEGTEAGRELRKRRESGMGLEDLKRFFEQTKHLLLPTPTHPEPSSIEAYLYAYSLITTRAFLIDIYHTLALVPFADILNHSSESHTSLASDDFVCHICGSLGECPHDNFVEGIAERLAHVDPISREVMGNEVDTVIMRSEKEIGAGEEVMNSYGKGIGDGRLLVEWGFVEGEFAGNGLEWTVDELIAPGSGPPRLHEEGRSPRPVYEEVIRRGAVALEIYPDSDLNDDGADDGEKLIGPSIDTSSKSSDLNDPVLNLNHNGQISLNIWIALCLQGSPVLLIEDLESKIVTSVHSVEMANIASRPTLDSITMETCQRVITLLKKRSEGLYRPTTPMEELLDQRDALVPGTNDLRMAMTLSIDERALLFSTLDQWEGIVGRVKVT